MLEVDQLGVSMARMKETLASFFEITASLRAETRFAPLLERMLFETVKIAQAQAGLIYLRENDGEQIKPYGLVINGTPRDLRPSRYKVMHWTPRTARSGSGNWAPRKPWCRPWASSRPPICVVSCWHWTPPRALDRHTPVQPSSGNRRRVSAIDH